METEGSLLYLHERCSFFLPEPDESNLRLPFTGPSNHKYRNYRK